MFELNIVLVEPQIPQNTGNIARTCAATGAKLHLVEPMGFEPDNAKLKRAGLDYWHFLNVQYYEGLDDFFEKTAGGGKYYYLSSKAPQSYTDVKINDGDYLLFGKETRGLPEALLAKNPERCLRIPMISEARCLNLSNSVAIVVYEALRQNNFEALSRESDYLYGIID